MNYVKILAVYTSPRFVSSFVSVLTPPSYSISTGEGYVTSYVEDTPSIGSFNYRLKGFRDPPTDIYPRAFFLVARRDRKAAYEICCGSEKLHNFHFDLMRKFYEQYPDRGKLLFHFTGKDI